MISLSHDEGMCGVVCAHAAGLCLPCVSCTVSEISCSISINPSLFNYLLIQSGGTDQDFIGKQVWGLVCFASIAVCHKGPLWQPGPYRDTLVCSENDEQPNVRCRSVSANCMGIHCSSTLGKTAGHPMLQVISFKNSVIDTWLTSNL